MNRLSFSIRGLGVLTVAAVLGLAGCSDHLTSPTPLLTKAQADSLGDAMVASAQSELDAATSTGASVNRASGPTKRSSAPSARVR